MHRLQILLDKSAVGLSLLCTIHCLVIPIFVISFPSLYVSLLDDELFHWLMITIVIPTSVVALTMGCRQHGRYHLLITGLTGIIFLVMAAYLDHEYLGGVGEKSLTVFGAGIIAVGHLFNYRLCARHHDGCPCHQEES